MKKMLLLCMAGSALLFSCGSNNTADSTVDADTASHAGHNTATNQSDNNNLNTAGPEASMMNIMEKNMQDMKTVQSTGNPDNDFAALMKVHHMGALDMAQLQVSRGADPQLKQMAQKMIDDQQKEIAELNTFLSGHSAHGGGDAFYKEVTGQMNNMKMEMDHSASIDKQFAQMMIPHHQGAIDMAKAYLKSGAHEERLKVMANKVISDQQKEIQQLQAWLNKNK